jgi:peptidoglycan L-alanyl-D-glutamate endopeptidase CwlK
MTFTLGATSREHLVGVNVDLARVVRRAIELSEQDFTVFEGLRDAARQAELYASGASDTMDSYHLPDERGIGHAVDLVPFIGGKPQWQDVPCVTIAKAMHRAAQQFDVPVTWGAVWDRELRALDATDLEQEIEDYAHRFRTRTGKRAFIDRPHFQVPRT